MGNDEGNPIVLVFDCIALGTHEIQTGDEVKLKKVLKRLSKIINTPVTKISSALYNYSPLDKNQKIKDLGVPSGGVIQIKFQD